MVITRNIPGRPNVSIQKELLNKQVNKLLKRPKLLELNPKNKEAALAGLLRLRRDQEALALLERLIQKEPKNWVWKLMSVEIRRQSGQKAEAARDINILVVLHPQNLHILKLKAILDIEAGNEKSSISLIQKNLETSTKQNRMQLGLLLADIYQEVGNKRAAIETYRALSQESPQDSSPLIGLALLRNEEGNKKKALSILRKAQILENGSTSSDPLIDRLASLWGLTTAQSRN